MFRIFLFVCFLGILYARNNKVTSDLPAYTNETILHRKLFKGYNKEVLPSMKNGDTLKVSFGVALTDIVELDHNRNTLHTNVWLRYSWPDVRLRWNPADYGGIEVTRLNPSQLWIPELVMYNSMKRSDDLFDKPALAVISFSGDVLWIPSVQLHSRCALDKSDTEHECTFKFASWTYDGFKLDPEFYDGLEEVDQNDYQSGNDWELVSTSAQKNVKYYPCCEEPYADLTFKVKIKRVSSKSWSWF